MAADNQITQTFLKIDERVWVALSSVLAAIILTLAKLVVGIVTGSIGILSEALHSALDLVAALITLFAVRSSKKPADKEYHYGYGKIESLSALIETLLLLIIVVWIIYEASRRIILDKLEVETNIWAFGVIIFAIIIDYSRSRALYNAAEKYDSQALKADALHFRTDILSSSIVFIGLVLTHFGFPLGDPLGAIGVAFVVLYLTFGLGKETIDSLLDKAPRGIGKRIREVIKTVPGVKGYETLRIRKSGSTIYVDLVCKLDINLSLEQSHEVAERINLAIQNVMDRKVDVILHTEPVSGVQSDLLGFIHNIANNTKNIEDIHRIQAYEIENKIYLTMHAEINSELSFGDAHTLISEFEMVIQNENSNVSEIITHIEPHISKKLYNYDEIIALQKINNIVQKNPILEDGHDIVIFRITENTYSLSMHCFAKKEIKIHKIHKATVYLEDEIKEEMPFFSNVIIHVEPFEI